MHDQGGRMEVGSSQCGRPLAIEGAVGPWCTSEFPFVEEELLCSAPGRFGIEDSVVGNSTLETRVVADDPIHHVSAVRGAHGAFLTFSYVRKVGFGKVQAPHQVDVGAPAPVTADSFEEPLAISGRTAGIDHDDHVAAGGKELSVPAVRPT